MKYATKDDLFIRFGKSNIVQWSDVENNQDETEIDRRIAWSIEQAEEEINERLRESPYQFPLTEKIPLSIRKTCSEIAAIYLYDSRRINDDKEGLDELSMIREGIDEYFRQIIGGKRILDLPRSTDIPFIVSQKDDNSHDHKWFCQK